jgi:hypothetical protein
MNEITPEMLNLAIMYLKSNGKHIKKIKVTSKFCNYLDQTCHPTFLNKDPLPQGAVGAFIGIPIELDDTIENEYYELEF